MALAGAELDGGPDGPAVDPEWGEPGLTPAENVYAWNSFALLTMVLGDPDAPANAIQPFARAHCQLRYIAGTDVDDVIPALRRHLDEHGFENVEVLPPPPDNAAGFAASRTDLDDPWAVRVLRSIERTTGARPATHPSDGGSICNDVFTDILGLPSIWIPHSYTSCLQHAPDEHVLLPLCREALGLMAGSTGTSAKRRAWARSARAAPGESHRLRPVARGRRGRGERSARGRERGRCGNRVLARADRRRPA